MKKSERSLHKVSRKVITAMIAIGMLASYTAFDTGFYNTAKISANAAVSENIVENDDFTFLKNDDGNTFRLTDYKGNDANVVVPSECNGKPVTAIGDGAFHGCENIETVTMPDSIVSIGNRAFYGCYKLTEVTIPKNVEEIGEAPFAHCEHIVKINVAEGNKTFKSIDGVLYDDIEKRLVQFPLGKEGEYSIPEGIKIIGASAFREAKIGWLTIPASLETIEHGTYDIYPSLYYCYSLKGFSVAEGSKNFAAYDDALYNIKDKELVQYPMRKEAGTVKIAPDTKSIGQCAFYFCDNITELILPEGLETIKDYAFDSSGSFKTVNIPQSVTKIGYDAFSSCSDLESINVDENNTAYSSDDGVLYDKEQTQLIRFPQSKAGSYKVLDTTKKIGSYAFDDCRMLTEVEIPDGVEVLDYCCFNGCEGLTEIEVPDSVTEMSNYAFQWCTNLERVKLSNSLKIIRWYTFDECHKLKSIVVPESVTRIDSGAFANCNELEKVVIPKTVTLIDNEYCPVLRGSEKAAIYGYKGSYAETYANENNIKFVPINDISNDNFTVEPIADQTETGEPITPSVVVKEDEKVLTEGKDYTVEYKDNVNAGTATVTIAGTGDYIGTREINFEILAKPVESDTSEESQDQSQDSSSDISTESSNQDSSNESSTESTSSVPSEDNSSTDKPATGNSSAPLFMAAILAVVSGIATLFTSRRKKSKQ